MSAVAAAALAVRELSLATLDGLQAEELALFCAIDERPLKGAAGYVDWRTNGWLSRLVLTGQFRCQRGERLLTLSPGRIQPSRVFLFGLGESSTWSVETAAALGAEVADALEAAAAQSVAVGYPGVGAEDAHRALLETLQKKMRIANMTAWGPWRKLNA